MLFYQTVSAIIPGPIPRGVRRHGGVDDPNLAWVDARLIVAQII
jgi:hypothetical protein